MALGLIDGEEALFIAATTLHVVGENMAGRSEAARPSRDPCNRLGRAHLWRTGSRRRVHLCTRHVDAAIFGARRRRPTRVCLQRMYDVADAGISWTHARRPTRVSFNTRMTWL